MDQVDTDPRWCGVWPHWAIDCSHPQRYRFRPREMVTAIEGEDNML
jgi:hypothetical protein